MNKMYKMCEVVEREIDKIAEKGLNTANLETAYKLIDMYKDLKNTEYWEQKEEYYMAVLDEMQSGYSQYDGYSNNYSDRSRKRDSMGRYSRTDDMRYRGGRSYMDGYSDGNAYYNRYMDSKQSYRNDKSMDGKQRLMDSLEQYMDDFTNKIREMHRDADTQEEREMISKFMNKLQNIR